MPLPFRTSYCCWPVWDLEQRQIASIIQWESNITAFKVIHDTSYMYKALCNLVTLTSTFSISFL
ncbi:hypothetical protein CRYUN_Cryun05aG0147800 [Craigia yunnanensis]